MAKFADIITAIRNDLVTGGVLDDINRIIPCARRKVPKLTGDKDIILRVSSSQVLVSVEGQGRDHMKMRRILEIIPRSRMAQDEVGKDTNWLGNEALGHLAFEDAIIDRLQLFHPRLTDASGYRTVEPMRLVGMMAPDKDVDPDGTWGATVQNWEVVYWQTCSPTSPTDPEHG